jgi:thiol-disulfide isomerase/thioredoxin
MITRTIIVGLFLLTLALLAIWVYTRPRVLTARLQRRNLAASLIRAGRPTVLAFTSPDCVACHTAQHPALLELTARMGDRVDIREVDVLTRRDAARAFGIFTVPSTVVVDADGKVVAFNIGYASAERLLTQLPVNGGIAPRSSERR